MRRKTQKEYDSEVKTVNPDILITGEYKNGNSKMSCVCLSCGYEWVSTARNLIQPKKCLRCIHADRKVSPINMTHREFVNCVKSINPHIKVVGNFKKGMNTITCICSRHGHKSRIRCNMLLKPYECKLCKNGQENVKVGVNDIHTSNPILGKMLLNIDDGYRYTVHSRNKVDFRCLNCGHIIRNKTISNVNRRGLSCICSDGRSFPEKYTYSVLSQICDNVKSEQCLNNNRNYRYDFIGHTNNGKVWIVEVMGKQHYEKSFETCGGRTLKEEKENDKLKYEFAIQNNINYYIYINASETCYNNMKQEITNSHLSVLYDLTNVDWERAYLDALSSSMFAACELWNQGVKNAPRIGELLNISRSTARKYLIKGSCIGLCDYNPDKVGKVKVLCLNTKEVFSSMREAERKYGIPRGYISGYLKGSHKASGELPNGEKLLWEYYNDYV